MKLARLDQQLNELTGMPAADLATAWQRAFHTSPPAVGHRLLALALAYRLQEQALGGLPKPQARELARLRARFEQTGKLDVDAAATLKVGTRLVRAWNGEAHQVLICDNGYQYRDRIWRSLTEIARAITGTNWSGPRFFGLTGSRKRHGEPADA